MMDNSDLTEDRIKNFKVKIKRDRYETRLAVTHNGYQWTTMSLNHEEMAKVIEVLQAELEQAKNDN